MRTRRLARFAFGLAAVLLLAAGPLVRGAIRFDVIVGYSGISPQNAWHPLTCEIQNTGASIDAVIEITSDRMILAPTRRLKLELPSNTTKRVTIPVFSPVRYNGQSIRILDLKGRVIAEPNFIGSQGTAGRPVLGYLSRASAGVPTMPDIKSRNADQQPLAVRMQPELFPDNPLVLDGLPALYLNSERAMGLTEPQVTALLAWIQHGGHLIIGVEQVADLTAKEWIRTLLPYDPGSTGLLPSHGELQNWIHDYVVNTDPDSTQAGSPTDAPRPQLIRPQAGGRPNTRNFNPPRQPAPEVPVDLTADVAFDTASLPLVTGRLRDGKILAGTASSPLIIQAQRGRGKISVLTFSPEREPFLSWKNRGWFWAKLTGVPSSVFKRSEPGANYGWQNSSTDGLFGWLVDSKQVRKLPLTWLLMLLATYLVVIGPLDQYILKKLKRQMLTWITFPMYVLAFSGLIYFIGFYLRAGDLECNELTVVDVLPNSQLARQTEAADGSATVGGDTAVLRGQTYCSIYSPVNNRYPLKGKQPFAALRGESTGPGRGQSTRAEIMQHGNGFDAEAFVAVWTSELYISDWLDSAPNPLGLTVKPKGKDWQVTIENGTGHALKPARIVLAQRIFTLGELPAGKSDFTLQREQGRMLYEFVNALAATLRSAADSRHNNFRDRSFETTSLPDSSMVASFPSLFANATSEWNTFTAPAGLDLAPYASQGHAILLAFDENRASSAPLSQFKARRSRSDTLLRLVLPMPGTSANIGAETGN